MAEEQEKDGGEIHTIGTVPPPPDGDAYDAPTKVGEVSSAVWKAIAPHLQGEAKLTPPRAPSFTADEVKAAEPGPPAADATVKVAPISTGNMPALSSGELPQMYDDEDGDGDNATLLHPSAKRFPLPPPNMPPPRMMSAHGGDDQAVPPPASLPIPEMVGPGGPDDKVWPFAPALIEPNASGDRKQAAIVAIAAAVVGVLVAIMLWRLWH